MTEERRTPTAKKDCRACRLGRLAIGIALQLIGSLLISFTLTFALRAAAGSAQASAAYYTDGCPGCPPGLALTSVEVQKREGSTLFVIGGTWPSSVAELKHDVRLVANDVDLVLRPQGEAFEVVRATRDLVPIPLQSIAAGIQSGFLVVDLSDPLLTAPVELSFGLWSPAGYTGRVPASGTLRWEGVGAPRVIAAAPTSPTATTAATASTRPTAPATGVPAATPVASPTARSVDPTILAGTCAAIPTGTVASYLVLDRVGSGIDTDPRTQALSPWVGAAGPGQIPAQGERKELSFAAVVSRAGQPNGTGARPIDRMGATQLWAYWDGGALHKGLRTWNGSAWEMKVDAEADAMTLALRANGVVFYWAGLRAGDRFGFVSAEASACRGVAIDTSGAPTETIR